MSKVAPTLFAILFFCLSLLSQEDYQVHTIAFYNVENAFDTLDDPTTNDDDRTPTGKDRWTFEVYKKKLANIAAVVPQIGSEITSSSPAIVGLCEIENRTVLDDLVQQPNLLRFNYGVIHFESPDERGIDVAFLYKKSVFVPQNFRKHVLYLFDKKGERDYTRDQLVVSGFLDGELLHFIVNHWPSRSGGQARSEPYRLRAALLNQRIIDSIERINPKAKIISMGDFNDDPTSDSFKKVLQTTGNKKEAEDKGLLFNPMGVIHKKGIGTSSYRDRWHVLDQIYITPSLLSSSHKRWCFWKAGVFRPSFLITPKGRYKGYPFRSFSNGAFTGGYSDHFPVYLYIIRKKETIN